MTRFESKAVANYFLDLAEAHGGPLTPMKLQKLVYFAHGWRLGLTGQPLLDEAIQAWSYGPVVRSLYKAFQSAGASPITEKATSVVVGDKIPGRFLPSFTIVVPSLNQYLPVEAEQVRRLLTRIWEVYGRFNGIQLSNMTHESGTPWHRVLIKYNGVIPNYETIPDEWIKEYFENQGGGHPS